MTKSELKALADRLGVQPSRKLGQNFLFDQNILRRIAKNAVEPGERVLEIGPGTGALTTQLLAREPAQLLALEYDLRLCEHLKHAYAEHDGVVISHGDACRFAYDEAFAGAPYVLAGNLPYASAGVILGRIMDCVWPQRIYLLLQREMGERLAAAPRCKAYGALSVRMQVVYETRLRHIVPPTVFWPKPKVESAEVSFCRRPDGPTPALYKKIVTLTRCGFNQRRKRLQRALSSVASQERLAEVFADLDLGTNVRAEELSPEQYRVLAERL